MLCNASIAPISPATTNEAADKESVGISSAASYMLQSRLTMPATTTTAAVKAAFATAAVEAATTLEGAAMGTAGDLTAETGLSIPIPATITTSTITAAIAIHKSATI